MGADASEFTPDPALPLLTQHRWALPVLAQLLEGSMGLDARRGGGARLIVLRNRLEAPLPSVKRALEGLAEQGWVEANPGDGHPLRPEYRLTREGILVAEAAEQVVARVRGLGLAEALTRKWSIPTTLAIAGDRHRFNDIKSALPGVTPRALVIALDDLESRALIERSTEGTRTPRPRYALTERVLPVIEPLAGLNASLSAA